MGLEEWDMGWVGPHRRPGKGSQRGRVKSPLFAAVLFRPDHFALLLPSYSRVRPPPLPGVARPERRSVQRGVGDLRSPLELRSPRCVADTWRFPSGKANVVTVWFNGPRAIT
ncbi:hypothetical protein NL676_030259 [Syzygium grande]|nr:hypothetical protein NL676_030259 [Syzygium grande]